MLRMRLLVLSLGLTLFLTIPADGTESRGPMKDCERHNGIVVGRHSASELRDAYESIQAAYRVALNCGQSLASRLAVLRGKKVRKPSKALEDCLRHGGRLTRRYGARALVRARRRMTREQRYHTRCDIGISSQLVALRPDARVRRPGVEILEGPLNQLDGEQLAERLADYAAVYRRPAQASDALSPRMRGFLESSQAESYDEDDARKVFSSPEAGTIWLVTADQAVCAAREFNEGTVAAGCFRPEAFAQGRPMFIMGLGPGPLHELWGVVPDQFQSARLIFGDGDRSDLETPENGLFTRLQHLPGALTWRTADGVRRWADTTFVPCAPETNHCLEL